MRLPLSPRFKARPKVARKKRIPSLPEPPAQIKRYGTKNPFPRLMESLTLTWQRIIWRMISLLRICRTCNTQSRAQEQCTLRIVHSGNEADSYVPKATKPLTRINQVKGINPDDIHDEVAFREHIWNNLVCLKERSKNYHLKYNEIVQTVEHIVFERAKHNLLGIRSDRIDSDILRALISEGVLIEQGTSARLKYDIFEDICFERYFDDKFQECRGNYNGGAIGLLSLPIMRHRKSI